MVSKTCNCTMFIIYFFIQSSVAFNLYISFNTSIDDETVINNLRDLSKPLCLIVEALESSCLSNASSNCYLYSTFIQPCVGSTIFGLDSSGVLLLNETQCFFYNLLIFLCDFGVVEETEIISTATTNNAITNSSTLPATAITAASTSANGITAASTPATVASTSATAITAASTLNTAITAASTPATATTAASTLNTATTAASTLSTSTTKQTTTSRTSMTTTTNTPVATTTKCVINLLGICIL